MIKYNPNLQFTIIHVVPNNYDCYSLDDGCIMVYNWNDCCIVEFYEGLQPWPKLWGMVNALLNHAESPEMVYKGCNHGCGGYVMVAQIVG